MLNFFTVAIFLILLSEVFSFSASGFIRIKSTRQAFGNPIRCKVDGVIEPASEISSKEITRLTLKVQELDRNIAEVLENIKVEDEELSRLNEEYGSEIARVKKEFNRIRERAVEESREATRMAKVDAVKAVLPITDNFLRAKQIYQPLITDGDKKIMGVYEEIFADFNSILEEFGVIRVTSVGQPFDFNTMEAIMMQPSSEYPKDIVSLEYQVGYKMGDKCIRPAMVVVSAGPGP